jgi:hypothetical protein
MFINPAIDQSLGDLESEINKHGRAPGRKKTEQPNIFHVLYEANGITCEMTSPLSASSEASVALYIRIYRNAQPNYRLEYTYVSREVNSSIRWYQRFRPELDPLSGGELGELLFSSIQELAGVDKNQIPVVSMQSPAPQVALQ